MQQPRTHSYTAAVTWTGNRGSGTSHYRSYERAYDVSAPGKPEIAGTSDPAFRGDARRWNPEELLVASLSACHMLWYLHLASAAGIVVTGYADEAEGTMEERGGEGRFVRAILRPRVTIAEGADAVKARDLHREAHEKCFIAQSVNFPVDCEPEII